MYKKISRWFDTNRIFLSEEEKDFLKQNTDQAIIPKNTVIMHQDRPVQKLYFINKGVVRLFGQQQNEDITIAFIKRMNLLPLLFTC